MGRWVPTVLPYVREWYEFDGVWYYYHAEVTTETGAKEQFDGGTNDPSWPRGKSTTDGVNEYHFDSKIMTARSGIWYDFSNSYLIRKGDSNGNFIQYYFDGSHRITQVVDTLGRTVYFYYDDPNDTTLLTRMTALNNAGVVQTYSFTYEVKPIQPNSYGYDHVQVPNTVKMLARIDLPDGKSWTFSYCSGYPGPSGTYLGRIDYPMGGYSRYEYQGASWFHYYPDSYRLDYGIYRQVTVQPLMPPTEGGKAPEDLCGSSEQPL